MSEENAIAIAEEITPKALKSETKNVNIKNGAAGNEEKLKKKKKTIRQKISYRLRKFFDSKPVQRIKSFKFGSRDHFGRNLDKAEGEVNEFQLSQAAAHCLAGGL